MGVLVAACVLIPIAIVAVVLAAGDDPAPTVAQDTATDEKIESEAQRLQRMTQTRDKEQVQELTDLMRRYAEDLDPVVEGIDKTLPPGDPRKVGPLADADDVREWVKTTADTAKYFDETVSGDTGTNVARGAFATAVRGIQRTAETYQLALRDRDERDTLLEHTRALRDDALDAWATAGIQMDVINIAVGFGHQHPPTPGARDLPPDELAEGTDATSGG
jgi:hypothetical protein